MFVTRPKKVAGPIAARCGQLANLIHHPDKPGGVFAPPCLLSSYSNLIHYPDKPGGVFAAPCPLSSYSNLIHYPDKPGGVFARSLSFI